MPIRPSLTCALLGALAACAPGGDVTEASFDESSWRAELADWHAGRLERLTSDTGWLSLAGLFWLEPGTHSAGSGARNRVRFPAGSAADVIGEFSVDDAGVTFAAAPDVSVTHDGKPVTRIAMHSDGGEETTVLSHRRLSWYVVERSGRFAIRLRDHDNPAIARFKGIETYPANSHWRVPARLERYTEPRTGRVPTVIDWWDYEPEIPGVLRFEIDGESYALEPAASGERYFIIFADATSGRETYGAGRFLYADAADQNGYTILDFNKAYNPPCVFNDHATCPVAPPQNRLAVAVTAGEKYDDSLRTD